MLTADKAKRLGWNLGTEWAQKFGRPVFRGSYIPMGCCKRADRRGLGMVNTTTRERSLCHGEACKLQSFRRRHYISLCTWLGDVRINRQLVTGESRHISPLQVASRLDMGSKFDSFANAGRCRRGSGPDPPVEAWRYWCLRRDWPPEAPTRGSRAQLQFSGGASSPSTTRRPHTQPGPHL